MSRIKRAHFPCKEVRDGCNNPATDLDFACGDMLDDPDIADGAR